MKKFILILLCVIFVSGQEVIYPKLSGKIRSAGRTKMLLCPPVCGGSAENYADDKNRKIMGQWVKDFEKANGREPTKAEVKKFFVREGIDSRVLEEFLSMFDE